MHKLCEYIDDELKELEKKVGNGAELTEREIEYGKNLAKFKMALLTNEAMERDGYSEGGMSYNRPYYDEMGGHSYGRRRDSMGRYSRNDGYSYAKHDMIKELHDLMKEAPEDMKPEFKRFIGRLEDK